LRTGDFIQTKKLVLLK